jgi:hypothetical protein
VTANTRSRSVFATPLAGEAIIFRFAEDEIEEAGLAGVKLFP